MPTKDDIEYYVQQLQEIKKNLGIIAAIFLVLLIILFFVLSRYLNNVIEKHVSVASEKTLKTFEANLDRENFRFQTMHQKQIDAIHNVYTEFNNLNITINFLIKGENFSAPGNPRDLLTQIITLRHSFKNTFLHNKLIFSEELCIKIESLIPKLDEFIEKFSNGLLPRMSEEEQRVNAEMNDGFILSGIWPANTLGELLNSMSEITTDIENEFRKIVGTGSN